ncbi:polysaccharide deacetylase family protein [Streptomyces pathocidini]
MFPHRSRRPPSGTRRHRGRHPLGRPVPALLQLLTLSLAACGTETAAHRVAVPGPSSAAPDTAVHAQAPGEAGPGRGARAEPRAESEGRAEAAEGRAEAASPRLPLTAGRTTVFEHGVRDRADKTVALTFDADMTPGQARRAAGGERFDNPPLVDSLRRLKVPATVFMTGRWAEEYPDQAVLLDRDPLFEVANHSYSHGAFTTPCYGLPPVAPGAMVRDIDRGFAALRRAGVSPVPYFRFPGGCFDERTLRAVTPAKVTAVHWDVVSGDAFAKDADRVAEQVLGQVRPGSVVVMHLTLSAAPATDAAVRRIVPELRDRGYRFVRVSELIAKTPGAMH